MADWRYAVCRRILFSETVKNGWRELRILSPRLLKSYKKLSMSLKNRLIFLWILYIMDLKRAMQTTQKARMNILLKRLTLPLGKRL